MKTVIKNWWPWLLLFLGGAIEFAGDLLPMLLKEANLSEQYASAIRIAMLAITIYKAKKASPSKNPEKLKVIYHKAKAKAKAKAAKETAA